MNGAALVATCWTSAGDIRPRDLPERSPFAIVDRVRAVAATGWAGIGFGQDDLRHARDTIGFAALREEIDRAGLSHVEVELVSDWWGDDDSWRDTWELLLDAARHLGAAFVKAGPGGTRPLDDMEPLVAPLRRLAQEAADAGTRVALEPLPFGQVGSVPHGADLIRRVDHPAAGLLVDFWHVFRAGTTLDELAASLDAGVVFGVELDDADAEVVGTLFEDTRDNRRLLGEGVQDVSGFIRTMRAIGFDGPWGVEILSDAHRRLPLEEALSSARRSAAEALARA